MKLCLNKTSRLCRRFEEVANYVSGFCRSELSNKAIHTFYAMKTIARRFLTILRQKKFTLMNLAFILFILSSGINCCGPSLTNHESPTSGVVEGTVVGKSHGIVFIQYKGDNHVGTWEPCPLVYAMIRIGYTTHVHWRVDAGIIEPSSRPAGYGAPAKLSATTCPAGIPDSPTGSNLNGLLPMSRPVEPIRLEDLR